MGSLIKQVFVLLSILLLLASSPLFLYEKSALNLFLAEHNSVLASDIFYLITQMGEGIFIVLISVVLLITHVGKATYIISSTISASLISQLIKHTLNLPRPKLYIENFESISHYCFWEIHSSFSFPSGHTTAAFSLFCAISLIYNNMKIAFICFILAVSVGLSRVYMLQHFFIDIYFGAILGIGISLILFKHIYPNFTGKQWAEFSLIKWIRSKV